MSGISKRKCQEILNSYTCDTSDLPDTSCVRAQELRDSRIFRSTFRRLTAWGMRENRYYRIYENSFSRCRTRFDECGRVVLTSSCRKECDCDKCRKQNNCSVESKNIHMDFRKAREEKSKELQKILVKKL